ncbi:hypothetical protein CY0110_19067 [Crocosphaera chwakensis CCY0110]|uniref:Uncharacterized protein n=1 Tax=Crocosphaera chwakensis CCY0110 TaxID=391612 RepID=A3IJE5_9CHRO|nr:hypothetical protein CY0110_19067 [Crocosphaera chwakensis CCY0110]
MPKTSISGIVINNKVAKISSIAPS